MAATDRDGKRKSGLSLLLNVRQWDPSPAGQGLSEWVRNDWRRSGILQVAEPGDPLKPDNEYRRTIYTGAQLS